MTDRFPEPIAVINETAFELQTLASVRRMVKQCALDAGVSDRRTADFVLAASEVASNSVMHGGGHGIMRIWCDETSLICEFTDAGHIANLSAATQPPASDIGGRGIWVATQMSDRIDIRTSPIGTTVRLALILKDH